VAKFNAGTSWPVEAGHPCIGCSEPKFWDNFTPFYEEL
jgi:[NiFe] hydrogenase small subunit